MTILCLPRQSADAAILDGEIVAVEEDGRLRHAQLVGLREDEKLQEVRREWMPPRT